MLYLKSGIPWDKVLDEQYDEMMRRQFKPRPSQPRMPEVHHVNHTEHEGVLPMDKSDEDWTKVTCETCKSLRLPVDLKRFAYRGRKLGEGASGPRPPTDEEWKTRMQEALGRLEQAHNDAVEELGTRHNEVVDRVHVIQKAIDDLALAMGIWQRAVEELRTRGVRATAKRAAEAMWLVWAWLTDKD
jgi:hypothetical protein